MAEDPRIEKLAALVTSSLAGGWGSNTDAQVEAWLMQSVTLQKDVSWLDFNRWCARYNAIVTLETAKANAANTANVRAAASFLLAVVNSGNDLPLSDNEIRTFLGNLIPGTFSTAQRDDLLAFSNETMLRNIREDVPRGIGAIQRARAIS